MHPRLNESLYARPKPTTPARTLLTVQQFAAKHPAWTLGAIRNLLFYATPRKSSHGPVLPNGLAPAIVRLGKKVMIDEVRFFEWLDSQQR